MPSKSVQQLLASAQNGNRRALAKLLSLVERDPVSAETAIQTIYPHTGNAHIVGITGSPGSGKSTLVNAITHQLRSQKRSVAVLAVDPTSPFSGGAVLGDRIRMEDHVADADVFVRSMASRGQTGGLAIAAEAAMQVMDAVGFDVVLVETVGAGQAEVDIVNSAHTTIVVEAPGMGDDIQTIKAGILEIADILVVNKADRPHKGVTVQALQAMLQLGHTQHAGHHGVGVSDHAEPTPYTQWRVPLIETIAIDGDGVDRLVDSLARHADYISSDDHVDEQRLQRSHQLVERLVLAHCQRQLHSRLNSAENQIIIQNVAARTDDPYTAARHIADQLLRH